MDCHTKDCINEASSALYLATLKKPDGTAVTAAMLTGVFLTLYDPETNDIVNGRHAQDVLNANDVSVDAEGQLSWQIRPADTIILDESKRRENRVALFTFTWSGTPGGQHSHEYPFQVKNLGPAIEET